jgi:hypothetical protein
MPSYEMPRVSDAHTTERVGVHAVGAKVAGELKWVFREQREADYGIDAHIEIVSEGKPTGRLIAAQIKSGESWFKEVNAEGFVFRGEQDHLDYWLNHKLPVIVIIYNPADSTAYWESVTKESVKRTEKGWKMTIPREQKIGASAASRLEQVSHGSPYFQRLTRLQLARPWMEALASGNELFIVAKEWVNKLSGKCSIELTLRDEDGEETTLGDWDYYVFYPGMGFGDSVQLEFPWASFSIDRDYHFWHEDGYLPKIDFDDDSDDSENGEEDLRPEIRPYEDNGEVASWRLELSLNDLGRAFLRTDKFLADEV